MEWRNGIVRILDARGNTVGTGFVVATGEDVGPLLVTCAHVVKNAGAGPGQSVNVRFHPTGEERTAYVVPEWWRDSQAEDVAFLQLEGPLPEDIVPLPLGTSEHSRGHQFESRGYRKPQVFEDALEAAGIIRGYTAYQGQRVLQLDSEHIDAGMSGAPVWDVQARRVVGMIKAFWEEAWLRDAGLSFAIPTETLWSVCAALTLSDLCPYRGLAAFTEAHAEFFFGRQRDVARLLSRLRRLPRFLAVLGPSGSGKSSLVQAGLIPRLREGKVPGSDRWRILLVDRPGANPLQWLEEAGLPNATVDLTSSVRAWFATHPAAERLLLIVDQFEEVLVSETDARMFLEQVATLIETDLPVTAVLVLRDDFYPRLVVTSPQGLQEHLETGLVNVSARMNQDDLRAVVARPAEMVGLRFEAGLVDRIVADAQDAWGADEERPARATILPLLEFALTQLWERRQEGVLTHAAYDALGRVTGALARWADAAYGALPQQERRLADRILTDLVAPGRPEENVPPTRRRRPLRDLCRDASEHDRVHRVVRHLADYRLVVTAREGEEETVELIHDALIWEWGHLQRLVESNRDFVRWHEEIRDAVRRWKAGEGDLLSGRALARAQEWLKAREKDLARDERAYITASARRARRNRYVLIGTTVLVMLVLSALTVVALVQRNQALQEASARATAQAQAQAEADRRATAQAEALAQRDQAEAARATAEAEAQARATAQAQAEARRQQAEEQRRLAQARQLAAQAQYMWRSPRSNTEKLIAPLLAIEVLKRTSSVEAYDVIQDVLFKWPRIHVIRHRSSVNDIAFSPDGRFLATASDDYTVALVETATGRELTRIHHEGSVRKVVFSLDGRFLATASDDGSTVLVETATGRELARIRHESLVDNVIFSPNGLFLATASWDGTAVLVEVATGRELARIRPGICILFLPYDSCIQIGFSPNSRFLAIAGRDDGTTVLIKTATGHELTRIRQNRGIKEIAFSPDSHFLATAAWDHTVALVETASGRTITLVRHKDTVWKVAFSPDSRFLTTASADDTAALVETATGHEIARIHHKGDVIDVTFSPDGRFLATASRDHTAALVETATGREITHTRHQDIVNEVLFTPDGRFLVTRSDDGTATLVKVSAGREITRISHEGRVNKALFSPDGRFLATASNDGTATLVETTFGREIARIHHNDIVWDVTFSPDSRFLATVSADGTVTLVDTISARQLIRVHHEPCSSTWTDFPLVCLRIAFSPDGHFLATAGWDDTVALIETTNGRELTRIPYETRVREITFSPDGRFLATRNDDDTVLFIENTTDQGFMHIRYKEDVSRIIFSPDGHFLAIQSNDGTVALVDTATGREVTHVQHKGIVLQVGFSPDSRFLVTASIDGTAILVDTAFGRKVHHIRHKGAVWNVAFSPDSHFLATASADGTATLIDTTSGHELTRIYHKDDVNKIAFSPNSRFLATASNDGTAVLLDVGTKREVIRIRHQRTVWEVAFSRDSRFLATASADGTAVLVDTISGRKFVRIRHERSVNKVAFSPDGHFLVTISDDGTVVFVDTVTGREYARTSLAEIALDFAISTDGRFLAIRNSNAAHLVDIGTGSEVARIQHSGVVLEVAFDPNSRFLATASGDGTAALMKVNQGQEIARIRHEDAVNKITFSPDGRFLATASDDGTAILVDVEQGQEIARIRHEGPVEDVAFSPDNRYLVTTGGKDVYILPLNQEELFAKVCERLPRNLTHAEWNRYIGPDEPYRPTCPNLPIPEE